MGTRKLKRRESGAGKDQPPPGSPPLWFGTLQSLPAHKDGLLCSLAVQIKARRQGGHLAKLSDARHPHSPQPPAPGGAQHCPALPLPPCSHCCGMHPHLSPPVSCPAMGVPVCPQHPPCTPKPSAISHHPTRAAVLGMGTGTAQSRTPPQDMGTRPKCPHSPADSASCLPSGNLTFPRRQVGDAPLTADGDLVQNRKLQMVFKLVLSKA